MENEFDEEPPPPPEAAVVEMFVTRPLAATVTTGIKVEEPNVPAGEVTVV